MNSSKAICNCSVAQIFWSYDQLIPSCLGFKIERIEQGTNQSEVLPAWVGFKSQSNQDWTPKDTSVWPIQKFNWRDLTAKEGKTYTYKITPMIGTVSNLRPDNSKVLQTNTVTISPELGSFKAFFTNGILSTQGLVHYLEGAHQQPNSISLMSHIKKPGDVLRNKLAGLSIQALTTLINKVKSDGGTLYCALYELNDSELINALLSIKKNLRLILSNTPSNESVLDGFGKTSKDLMKSSLAPGNFYYRVVPTNHIGHNKFAVYLNPQGQPTSVLSGSTNWTVTGLCAQSNNQIIMELPAVAKFYKQYWDSLLVDTTQDDSKQSPDFRNKNNVVRSSAVGNSGEDVDIWFSPNTKATSKGSITPGDLSEVFSLMANAQQAILFLVFQPGAPSIMDQALLCQENNPKLFIRGAATDSKAVENYDTNLFHSGIKTPDTVVAASAVNDQFAYWQKELLKTQGAHAIIHDKVVVIDPFSDNCVVITGSHNLGFKASYCNDENMVIVKGNRALAEAYTTHILDVYDHYRWRYQMENKSGDRSVFYGLEEDDQWQKKYFSGSNAMQGFWNPNPAANATKTKAAPIAKASANPKTASKAKSPSPKKAKKVAPKKAKKAAPKRVRGR